MARPVSRRRRTRWSDWVAILLFGYLAICFAAWLEAGHVIVLDLL